MIIYETITFLGGQLTLFKQDDALVFVSLADDGVADFKSFYPTVDVIADNVPEVALFKHYAAGEVIDWRQLKINYLSGTKFQREVWLAMHNMMPHEYLTYAELAQRANHPTAIRAVASAIGKNPLTIINACHRILPKSGGIGQYRYGSHIKAELLALDRVKI
ncbi:MAG: methylated-DNA--[protein]-cysteine S-methyltransferase [Leuconostoc carnosum]|uniref:methylated-DNA--[protein]-cysteine S-methyltransferase n=1 Tax=Leuconostoc carnosum TaxID=1252 RepID=UPI003F9D7FFE